MARAASSLVPAVLLLSLAAGRAPGQEPPPPPSPSPREVVGRALTAARASGALQRVLDERSYLFRFFLRGPGIPPEEEEQEETLVTVRGELAPDGSSVTFEMRAHQPPGREPDMRWTCEVGLDGRLRRSVHASEGGEVVLAVEGGQLVTRFPGREPSRTAWDDRMVPDLLALFVLPRLFDGLPADLAFLAIGPAGPERVTTRLRVEPGDEASPGGPLRHVTYLKPDREEDGTTHFRVHAGGASQGAIVRIDSTRPQTMQTEEGVVPIDATMSAEPVTREQADALLRSFEGSGPPPGPVPPPPEPVPPPR